MDVHGSLITLGTEDHPVEFIPENDSTSWRGITVISDGSFNTPEIVLDNCIISGVSAESSSVVINENHNSSISNCIFENNFVSSNGGAIGVYGCSPTISNNIFRDNYALLGGALYFLSTAYSLV